MSPNKIFRLFENLPQALWEDFENVNMKQLPDNANVQLDGDNIKINFLGATYILEKTKRNIIPPQNRPPITYEMGLVILTYLTNAKGIGPGEKFLAGAEVPGGNLFFQGPHVLATKDLENKFTKNPKDLLSKALSLGAKEVTNSKTSLAFEWQILPNIKIFCNFYFADDEYPATATYSFDSYAHFNLPLDAMWSSINIVTEVLTEG